MRRGEAVPGRPGIAAEGPGPAASRTESEQPAAQRAAGRVIAEAGGPGTRRSADGAHVVVRATPQASPPLAVPAPAEAAGRERFADARAAELLSEQPAHEPGPAPALVPAPAAPDPPPPGPAAVLAAGGSSLASPERAFAARFGMHAARLVIHDGAVAAQAANALGARAFAHGRHIVFGAGQHRPGTDAGDRLLAHEIAHLEHQASVGSAALDLAPDVTLPPRYRPLLDRIASDEASKASTYGIGGWHLPVLYKLKALAEAVESGDAKATKAAVTAFVSAARNAPLDPATAVLLDDVPLVLVSRIYLMGLAAESRQLQDYVFGAEGKQYYEQPATGFGYASEFAVWRRITEDAIAASAPADATTAQASIDLLLVAFKGVNGAAGALDPKQVERDLKAQAGLAASYPGSLWPRDADATIGAYFSHLLTLVPPLVVEIERAFQVLLDLAIADLQAGKGSTALDGLRAVLETKLRPAFDYGRLLDIRLPVTRSDFQGKRKRHLDYFDTGKSAATAEIHAFSNDDFYFSEKELTLRRIYEIRERQIATLARLFGFAKDKTNAITAESKENAAAIQSLPGFKLHDDDSWRTFLLAKFRASRARLPDDWTALSATIEVLHDYVRAFTIHTPYNIDEFGDNYVGRTFPRALTGQFIEDCGVYALKIAYALSLVRQELGLEFRAVVMPVHVGLVITFKDLAKGAFFVNNDAFTPVDSVQLAALAATWQQYDASHAARAKPVPLDRTQFLGEVAAATFVERTDMPFRVEDVPAVPDIANARKRHDVLWSFYHRHVTNKPVTAPVKEVDQPELQFLALLEHGKNVYNQLAVPLWRRAHDRFETDHIALNAAATELTAADPNVHARAVATLAAHRARLLELAKPVRDEIERLDREREEVTKFMREHPGAAARGTRVAPWMRLNLSFNWELRLNDYLGDDKTPGQLMEGKLQLTPWRGPEDMLEPVD